MRHALQGLLLPLLVWVWAHPCPVFSAPMRCAVVEASTLGGVVEVNTDDSPAPDGWPPGSWPLQIRWKPPPAAQSPALVVGYVGSTLEKMGIEPGGWRIRFHVSPPTTDDDTRVIVSLPDGASWVFRGDDLQYGRDFGSEDDSRPAMDIGFGSDSEDARWPKIKSALRKGPRLRVQLVRHGETLADVVFDLSNRKARDALLVIARQQVLSADPQACTDTALPIKRGIEP